MTCLPIPYRNEQSVTFHITIQELMYGKHGSWVPDYYHYNHSFLRLCFGLMTMVTVTSTPVLSGVRLVLVLVSLMCSSYYENQSVSIPSGKFSSGEVSLCHQGLQLAGHHIITAEQLHHNVGNIAGLRYIRRTVSTGGIAEEAGVRLLHVRDQVLIDLGKQFALLFVDDGQCFHNILAVTSLAIMPVCFPNGLKDPLTLHRVLLHNMKGNCDGGNMGGVVNAVRFHDLGQLRIYGKIRIRFRCDETGAELGMLRNLDAVLILLGEELRFIGVAQAGLNVCQNGQKPGGFRCLPASLTVNDGELAFVLAIGNLNLASLCIIPVVCHIHDDGRTGSTDLALIILINEAEVNWDVHDLLAVHDNSVLLGCVNDHLAADDVRADGLNGLVGLFHNFAPCLLFIFAYISSRLVA
uniref:Uncharacterized protein n=1 Tax=Siphoviridae sp. ct96x5 TaxID=2825367 RepID=A0A8S5PSZ5_9CAUD|nr:MAG TPA: hypothetical protein [Siphoviridae sp. ct96x5]